MFRDDLSASLVTVESQLYVKRMQDVMLYYIILYYIILYYIILYYIILYYIILYYIILYYIVSCPVVFNLFWSGPLTSPSPVKHACINGDN